MILCIPMSVNTRASSIVRLQLTAKQTEQLAPLVQQAATESKNVLFVAVAVPFWRNDATIWELQAVLVLAQIGQKITKLVALQKGGEVID